MVEVLFVDHDLGSAVTINQEGRNPVRRSLEGAFIYKPKGAKELRNYSILNKYREDLANRGVYYPVLVKNKGLTDKKGNEYIALITLPFFDRYNIAQRFGRFELGDHRFAFSCLLGAFDAFEKVLPTNLFSTEADEEELAGVLDMIKTEYSKIENFFREKGIESSCVFDLISKSQRFIEGLPRVVQHKDANPSNWRIITINASSAVNVIDMETLGLARRGWDEGRVYVQMCLDENKQDSFLGVLYQHPKFHSEEAKVYFWRVVLFRCIRELSLVCSGKYSSAISEYERLAGQNSVTNDIKTRLLKTAQRAISEMRLKLNS